MDPKFEKLIVYLADSLMMESRLLHPRPQPYVYLVPLLDFLSHDLELSQEAVARIFNSRQEQIENAKKKKPPTSQGDERLLPNDFTPDKK